MPAPLPIELRQRVVDAYNKKGGYQRISDQFKVSFDSVRRWVFLEKTQNSVKPKPHAGGPSPKILSSQHDELLKIINEHPDNTLAEIADIWKSKFDIEIHVSSIWRALYKANISYKKNLLCH